jgi:formate/nitrite transporter FocA (FNT family)
VSEDGTTNFGVEGLKLMDIREGLIPTALGTAVTAAGYAMKQTRGSNKMVANTVFGFGLAHVVLGVIDLVEHRR